MNPTTAKFAIISAIIILSFTIKIALAWITRDTLSYFDEWGYYEAAESLLDDPGFNEVFRPPGYICFLASIFWIFGKNLFTVKAAQVLLSTISIILLYAIAKKLFSEKVALLAAGIFAFYPNLVAYTHYLWSETLYIFLVLALFYLLFQIPHDYSRYRIILSGLTLGTVALTRTDMLPPILICIVYLALVRQSWGRLISSLLLFLLGVAIVIAPWVVRNHIATGRFLICATEPKRHLWHSFNVMPCYGWDYRVYELFDEPGFYEEDDNIFPGSKVGRQINRPESSRVNPVDAYREEMTNAINFALNNPGLVLRRIWPKFCILWGPNSFVIRHLRLGIYGKNFATAGWPVEIYPAPSKKLVQAVTLAVTLSYALVNVTALLGLIFHRWRKETFTLALFLLSCTLLRSLLMGMSRYRLPMIPILIIFSAYGICHVREIIQAPDKKVRWLLFLFLFLLFLVICAIHFPILFDIF